MQMKKGFSWGEAIFKTLLTGGIWLFYRLAAEAIHAYRRAWSLRAAHVLGNPGADSPWPWIRSYWLASILGIIAVEFWTIVYLSAATLLLPRAMFMTRAGHLSGVPLLLSIPVIMAHFAWAGSVCVLIGQTLWPSSIVSAVKGRLAAWRPRPRGASQNI